MKASILILAAGASSRMRGGDKLLERVDGLPLLARTVRNALTTGLPVTVVLPPDRPDRAQALHGLPVATVTAPTARDGMAESLKAGMSGLPADHAVMLLLGDLPDLTADDLQAVVRDWKTEPDAILRGAAADGTAGHPVCFPPDLRDDLMTLKGDEGARSVLVRHRARLRMVPLPDRHAVTDLDTPEDWAAWRAGRISGDGA